MARRSRKLTHRQPLSHAEEFELLLGPDAANPAFADDEARRAAWSLHRDQLLAECHLHRHWAFWEYDVGEQPHREHFREGDMDALIRLRPAAITEKERRILEIEDPPGEDFGDAVGHFGFWDGQLKTAKVRTAWHARENRSEMHAKWYARYRYLDKNHPSKIQFL